MQRSDKESNLQQRSSRAKGKLTFEKQNTFPSSSRSYPEDQDHSRSVLHRDRYTQKESAEGREFLLLKYE